MSQTFRTIKTWTNCINVSNLRQVGGFLRILRFPPPIKTDRHDIPEILLKVALNTINQTKPINDVLDTTLCDQVCLWLATGRWFSPGTPPRYTCSWIIVDSGVKHHNPINDIQCTYISKNNVTNIST